jgi:DNA-binding FrmR family transcriptional regulator
MKPETKKDVQARLRRIAGQVEGIQRMLDEDRYCVDVLLQVAAVKAATERVGQIILGSHVDTCVNTAFESGNKREARKKVDELMEVFSRFGGIRRG